MSDYFLFNRTLADEVEDLSKVSFVFPADALQPVAGATRTAAAFPRQSPEKPPAGSPAAAAAVMDPHAADRSVLAGTGLEDLFDPSPTGAKSSCFPFGFYGCSPNIHKYSCVNFSRDV